MKNQFVKLVAVALTGATMAWSMSCNNDNDDPKKPKEDPTLSVTPNAAVEFNSDGTTSGETTFAVETNQSKWEAKSDKTWLTVTPNEAAKTFVLSAKRNEFTEQKVAKVTITAGDAEPVTINVTQKGGTFVNITDEKLTNYEIPFDYGALSCVIFYDLDGGWTTNESGRANGNVCVAGDFNCLTFWSYGAGNVNPIINGKLYQTVSLEAGTYHFDAYVGSSAANLQMVNLAAAIGGELPDMAEWDYVTEPLVYERISGDELGVDFFDPENGEWVVSIEFTLDQTRTVSLGFNACYVGDADIRFKKVELWMVR